MKEWGRLGVKQMVFKILTIGKESDWRIEILEKERKVRISSHKIIVCYL